jgi:hypothetical protein
MSFLLIKTYAGMLFMSSIKKVVISFLLCYCLVFDRDMFGLISENEAASSKRENFDVTPWWLICEGEPMWNKELVFFRNCVELWQWSNENRAFYNQVKFCWVTWRRDITSN